jgi:hypothetical protein
LTLKAKKYAKRLPDLLEDEGFSAEDIDIVYYDSSKKFVPNQQKELQIKRCQETVRHIHGPRHQNYSRSDIGTVLFSTQNAAKTIVICYQSETLSLLPKVDSQKLRDFMINDCPRVKKTKYEKCTDPLYEQILILDVTTSGLTKQRWVATKTRKDRYMKTRICHLFTKILELLKRRQTSSF